MRRLTDLLAMLAGADLEVLAQAKSERGKLVSLGLVMIGTASVAALSMVFALRNAVFVVVDPKTWLPAKDQPVGMLLVSIIIGMLWGCMILVLDRALIITMQDVAGRRALLYAAPRVLLAIVIGVVVSTPITLQVFHSEITAQVKLQNQEELNDNQREVENGETAQKLKEVQEEIDRLERVLRGELGTVTTPELAVAQDAYDLAVQKEASERDLKDKAYVAMICEVEGAGATHPDCQGVSSNVPGRGDLYYAREAEYFNALGRWNTAKTVLADAEKSLQIALAAAAEEQRGSLGAAQEQAQLDLCGIAPNSSPPVADVDCGTGLRNQAEGLRETLLALQDPQAFLNRQGLSQQITALMSLGKAHLWVAALFMVIELLPVLIKTFMALKGVTQYDRIAKKMRDDEFNSVETETQEKQSQRDRETLKKEKIRNDMLQREIALGVTANEHVANEMEGILVAALTKWSAHVTDTLEANQATVGVNQPGTTESFSTFGLPAEANV